MLPGTEKSVAVLVVAEEMKGDEGAGYLSVESGSSAGHNNSTWMY